MKAILILALQAALLAAGAEEPRIALDAEWADVAGNEIQAQGGCVLKFGDTFYWYGVEFSGETPKQVRCYSSKDLARWKFEGPVLAAHVSRRVKVLYSPALKQFVLFTREGTKLGISVSSTPAGAFTWKGESELPGAAGNGDANAFLDDDGKAYVVYTADAGDGKARILCAELKPDWTGAAAVVQEFPAGAMESPSLWKRGAVYYCTASGMNGWFSSATSYSTAPSLSGPWSPWKTIFRSMQGAPLLGSTFNSQHNTVVKIEGTQGVLFVYMGDRWSQFTKYGVGKQVWLPVEFVDDAPMLTWLRPWYPDVTQGTYQHDLRRYGLWRDPPKK